MSNSKPAPNPFDGFSISTGFAYNELVPGVQFCTVQVDVTGGGEKLRSAEIFRYRNGDGEDQGIATRKMRLVEALCRYMNAGGSTIELTELFNAWGAFRDLELRPEGYSLLQHMVNIEEEQVVFVDFKTGHCWVITPDVITDECTINDILNEQ